VATVKKASFHHFHNKENYVGPNNIFGLFGVS